MLDFIQQFTHYLTDEILNLGEPEAPHIRISQDVSVDLNLKRRTLVSFHEPKENGEGGIRTLDKSYLL